MSASSSNVKYESLNIAAAQADSAVSTNSSATPEAVAVQVDSMSMYSKPEAVAEPVASPMMLEVVAPASLWEGYELEVNVGGETCTVIVPPGGVEQGQAFMAAISQSSAQRNRHRVPVGAWKDGLCDCCTYGCCHPLVWVSWCCFPVLVGQILYRLKMDWCGFPTTGERAEETFFVVVGIFVGWIALRQFIIPGIMSGNPDDSFGLLWLSFIVDIAFFVYMMLAGIRARRFIRNKYAIPTQCCGECEDCCCIFWCKCCTFSQMARHTADYETYAAHCCTKSGLPPHVPEIV